MRIVQTVALALALSLSLGTLARAADSYKIDPVHSFVVFKIGHLNVSHVYGRFNEPTGTISLDESDPSKTTIEAQVDVEKIDTANPKRNDDLKKPDFFNAKQFPTITFKSTSAKKADDKTIEVTGDLTLHGVTKSITVKLTQGGPGKGMRGETRAGLETELEIKRSDFGMTNMAGMIGDDVKLMISLEAIKQ